MLKALHGALQRRAFLAALLQAAGRFLTLLGVLALCGWSYSLWGSGETPLKSMLIPGLVLLAGGWVVGILFDKALGRVDHHLRAYLDGLEAARRTESEKGPE
jgi:hypothetical protein